MANTNSTAAVGGVKVGPKAKSAEPALARSLGLKEAITMTIGTVVGVGLFTVGSAEIGVMGKFIFVATLISLLISIWPVLLYSEMGAALPCAGGTYNYAKRGINRIFANMAGWNYIIAVVAICSGESLAFANYFSILLESFGVAVTVDPRIIACILVGAFIILNYRGIKVAGKWQDIFMFFFWGCSLVWFIMMAPHINLSFFGAGYGSIPAGPQFLYILGLVWWCYTGFETAVSMGAEIKYPQVVIPKALKIALFLIFAVTAIFQWFLVGLVPPAFYSQLVTAVAPYADGLKMAGLIGAPIIILCIAIAFGGDLSTINPGIAAPARYIYTMAEDHALPSFLASTHKKYKSPDKAILLVGIINILLIATNSINFIASVSLFSLLLCYMIGCLAYVGLKKREPDMDRPYKAPAGVFGAWLTIVIYAVMMTQVDTSALITGVIITACAIITYFLYTRKHAAPIPPIAEEIGEVEIPSAGELTSINKEYKIWKIFASVASVVAVLLYVIPLFV